jgi:hypothetical protein
MIQKQFTFLYEFGHISAGRGGFSAMMDRHSALASVLKSILPIAGKLAGNFFE